MAPHFSTLAWKEYWSGLPIPSLEDLPDPRIKPASPVSPALQADSLPLSHWGSYVYITVKSSSWIDSLIIMQCVFCLLLQFCFRVILSDISIATPPFISFPLTWNIFFHSLIVSLLVSLDLKWVSYRQHMYGSCFCIHSATLCLLIEVFSSFTFKIIVDRHVLIAILLFWGCFCSSFLFLSSSVLFPCYLMTIFSIMFGVLSFCCVGMYHKFLVCGYCEVCMCIYMYANTHMCVCVCI